jgi:hypothetical protein
MSKKLKSEIISFILKTNIGAYKGHSVVFSVISLFINFIPICNLILSPLLLLEFFWCLIKFHSINLFLPLNLFLMALNIVEKLLLWL